MTRSREKVFIVYSHQDAKWLNRLQVHLTPLERQGLIERWDDTRIAPGTSWRGEIRKALESVKVAVLLVSADFLASEFIADNELPPLLPAAQSEGVVILPVIVSPCLFTNVPALAQFQTVNDPSKPLSGLTKAEQDKTFVHIADVILRLLDQPAAGAGSIAVIGDAHHIVVPDTTLGPGFEEIMRQFALIQEQLAQRQVASRGGPKGTRRIFIVHGHDDAAKEMVARFLTHWVWNR